MPRNFDRIDKERATNRVHGQYDDIDQIALSGKRNEYVREVPIKKVQYPANLHPKTRTLEKERLDQLLESYDTDSTTIFGLVDNSSSLSSKLIIVVPPNMPLPNDDSIIFIDNDDLINELSEKSSDQLMRSPSYRKQMDVDDAARTTYYLQLLSRFYANEPSDDIEGLDKSPAKTFEDFSNFYLGLQIKENNLNNKTMKDLGTLQILINLFIESTTIKNTGDQGDILLENLPQAASVLVKPVGIGEYEERMTIVDEDQIFISNNFDDFFKLKLIEMETLWLECREWLDNEELIDKIFEEKIVFNKDAIKKIELTTEKRIEHVKSLEKQLELNTNITNVLSFKVTEPKLRTNVEDAGVIREVKQEDILAILQENIKEIEQEEQLPKQPTVIFEREKTRPIIPKKITKSFLRENDNVVFVFGDNLKETGKGGAAKLRDEPNTYGFTTKKEPGNKDSDFFKKPEYGFVYRREIKRLKNEIFSNQDKTYIISDLGGGLANRFHIKEEVIQMNLRDDLAEHDNVVFLEPLSKPDKPLPQKQSRRRKQREKKKIQLATETKAQLVPALKHQLESEDYEVEIDGNNFSAFGEDGDNARIIVGSISDNNIENVSITEDEFGNERNTGITIEQTDKDGDPIPDTTIFINDRDINKQEELD